MKDYILEVCVDSVEGAIAAESGGANRIELCGNLIIGGTSPDLALVELVLSEVSIPVRAMLRPRFGDFCYTNYEFEIMEKMASKFVDLGVEGLVCGILNPDGTLDRERMSTIRAISRSRKLTLHRAFDMTSDPFVALENAKHIGIDTILTSGQKNTCLEGKELLKELVEQNTSIEILAGASISPEAIEVLRPYAGISSYHLSGKRMTESPMQYRNPNVAMGLPSMSEYQIWECDSNKIASAKNVLDTIA